MSFLDEPQGHHQDASRALTSETTKTEKSHAALRRAIGLLHPAGSSSAGRAKFNDEHFRPAGAAPS